VALDGIARIHQSPLMYRMIGADGREYGPISAEQLRQWIGQGRADANTRVLAEGVTEWKPLGSLPEFSMLFAAPSPAPAPTPGPVTSATFPDQTVQVRRTNGFAIAGLVCGVFAITFGLCCCYGLPFNITGLILSFVAIGQMNAHPERYDGKTMAIIGIVLSALSLLIAVGMFCLGIGSALWDSTSHHGYRL